MIEPRVLYHALQPYLRDPVRRGVRLWSYCPVHPDGQKRGRRSLSLHPQYGLRCFAGCDWQDVAEALAGPDWRSLLVQRRNGSSATPPTVHPPVAEYVYHDLSGAPAAVKGRWEYFEGTARKKTFRWRKYDSPTWDGGVDLSTLALYRIDEALALPEEQWIVFTEGEKAADACWAHGIPAVCAACGASPAPPIVQALSALRGRRVAIWPDNDEAGYRYAQIIRGMLRPIARELRILSVPVPEKGDAYDYFAAGGTPEGIWHGPSDMVVSAIGRDHVRVFLPGPPAVTLDASEIVVSRHSVEVVLTVRGVGEQSFRQRINLLSHSARQALVSELRAMYGKEYPYVQWLHTLSDAVHHHISASHAITDAAEIATPEQPEWLVYGVAPVGEPVVFYGYGDSGKTYLCLSLAASIAWNMPWLGCGVRGGPVLWVDYETEPSRWKLRLSRVLAGMSRPDASQRLYYLRATAPLADIVPELQRFIEQAGIIAVFIDSAVAACGYAARDEAAVVSYFQDIRKLGVTTITVAHVAADGDIWKPFGSVFWLNAPRSVWYVFRDHDLSTKTTMTVGLSAMKQNDIADEDRIVASISFDDPTGPVMFDRLPPWHIAEWPKKGAPRLS